MTLFSSGFNARAHGSSSQTLWLGRFSSNVSCWFGGLFLAVFWASPSGGWGYHQLDSAMQRPSFSFCSSHWISPLPLPLRTPKESKQKICRRRSRKWSWTGSKTRRTQLTAQLNCAFSAPLLCSSYTARPLGFADDDDDGGALNNNLTLAIKIFRMEVGSSCSSGVWSFGQRVVCWRLEWTTKEAPIVGFATFNSGFLHKKTVQCHRFFTDHSIPRHPISNILSANRVVILVRPLGHEVLISAPSCGESRSRDRDPPSSVRSWKPYKRGWQLLLPARQIASQSQASA